MTQNEAEKFKKLRSKKTVEKIRSIIHPPIWIPANTQGDSAKKENEKSFEDEYSIMSNKNINYLSKPYNYGGVSGRNSNLDNYQNNFSRIQSK